TWDDQGYNAATDASCLGSPQPGTDAVSAQAGDLGSLADNGGPTQTMALAPDNPALGLIANPATFLVGATGSTVTVACPVTADQRGSGFGSVAASSCDAGAIQLETQSVSFSSSAPSSAVVGGPSYTPTASSGAGLPVSITIDSSTTNSACTLSGGVVSLNHAGSCVIDAGAGSVNFAHDQAQQTITVAAATTSTSLTVAPSSLTATVSAVTPGSGTPTGTVDFTVGGQTLGDASLVNGVATLAYSVPDNTTETVTAGYQGSDDYKASSASQTAAGATVAVPRIGSPSITASLSSSRRRSAGGWWHTAVEVTFTCDASGSTITGGCPAAVRLATSGRNQTVTRTVTTAHGDTATITLVGIDIDLTRPSVRIAGVRGRAHYQGAAPAARCTARDRISGIESCRLHRQVRRTAAGETVTYTATATSWAGTKRTVRTTIYVRL
ncbi:MAG: choice-of-anchor Q domain-containing protein, partial [Solirubrobacteraceae bacterium]